MTHRHPLHPLTPVGRRRCLLQLGAAGLLGVAGLPLAFARNEASPRAVAPRGPLATDELNNIAVFKAVSPSVVNITALGVERDFFSTRVTQVPRGTGTGFVWDEAGHIVTNFHVIQEASGARVTLSDQSSHKASLVGVFPDRDLAVLKIEAPRNKLPPIALGSSKDLQVGQKVYAIGNPFGLDQTLTTGIVSALNREIESVTRRTIRGAIQTDAAINPGNSGGPLLDSAGRVIGVNTAIYSPSGASAGIGFAIPVDEVNRIVPRLIRDGRMVRPALGVTAGPENMAKALGLPKGVPLVAVAPGGPAQKAGLRPFTRGAQGGIVAGDVIQAIDDAAVADLDDMLTALERYQPGDRVTLTLWRAGAVRRQAAVLAESED
ncbi:trypsin-like peptidase domain-containing protein [Aquincola tertiaricarbonis]|uniref:Trypsin-like peptidase domain-containing protein n=1 Tax=Aquincola tertiaricarbonis TaxID=391953 RepID=A0ABY4SGZ1_AQUTE|nr:trypsin-like peptidase domain-containing protein [Aquincola tertiaricarbonis]URI11784.1 trypsin-like peptidase domain-containing protein [Aquincola tertiaricarbonis]